MTTRPRGKAAKPSPKPRKCPINGHIPRKALKTVKPLKIFYEAFIRVSEREYAQIIAKRTKKECGYALKVRRVAV